MDEKSADPLQYPINKSTPPNQMRAILTTNGFIKIVLSDEPLSDNKEKFLSKEASTANLPNEPIVSALCVEKSFQETVVLKEDFKNDNNQYLEFKQTPRQVFMSTICHVRFIEQFINQVQHS